MSGSIFDFAVPGALAAVSPAAAGLAVRGRRPARLRAMKELDPGYLQVREALQGGPRGREPVTHFWPPGVGTDYLTPCCGVDPLALPGNARFTYQAGEVNCPSALTGGGT